MNHIDHIENAERSISTWHSHVNEGNIYDGIVPSLRSTSTWHCHVDEGNIYNGIDPTLCSTSTWHCHVDEGNIYNGIDPSLCSTPLRMTTLFPCVLWRPFKPHRYIEDIGLLRRKFEALLQLCATCFLFYVSMCPMWFIKVLTVNRNDSESLKLCGTLLVYPFSMSLCVLCGFN